VDGQTTALAEQQLPISENRHVGFMLNRASGSTGPRTGGAAEPLVGFVKTQFSDPNRRTSDGCLLLLALELSLHAKPILLGLKAVG
jgi:hypothetical protein